MSRQHEIDEILQVVSEAYGSLEEPNYHFTWEVMERRPYDEVINEVERYFSLEERTAPDDDVSFVYYMDANPPPGQITDTHFLTLQNARWLKLSMLGPYGMFLRFYPGRPKRAKVLIAEVEGLSVAEQAVVELMEDNGITLLGKELLVHPVPIEMFNVSADEAKLYNALFSDDYLLDFAQLE